MSQIESVPDTVWAATVDDQTWEVRVIRTRERVGVLGVTKIENGEVILSEEVGLAFGALFGPDIDDVNQWMVMALEAIDHYYAQHPETS